MASSSPAPAALHQVVSFAEDFVIRPPQTTEDDGKPSSSVLKDVRRVLALIQDERHLSAYTIYQDVLRRLDEHNQKTQEINRSPGRHLFRRKHSTKKVSQADHEVSAAKSLLVTKRAEMEKLVKMAEVVLSAKQTLSENNDWIFSQTLFGVTTYYRREADNSLSIKLEGEMTGVPLFEQVAVLKEVDLHYKWAPFTPSSLSIKDLDKLDTVGWFVVGLPQFGLARDACFRAFGSDNMLEDGTILLVGQGVSDRPEDESYEYPYLADIPDTVELPPPPTRMGSGRMTIRKFSAIVHVKSPTKMTTLLVANIDPHLNFIPQSLLDFVMRKLCGVILNKLQRAAKKANTDPERNAHARRMRREEDFYKGWLMPKFQAVCDKLNWTMPPVPAFELSPMQVERELIRRGITSFDEGEDQTDLDATPVLERASSSAPALRGLTNDEMSAITTASSSSSILMNNPIAQYLREMEARTQKAKAAKIASARQRAADRLKRKELPADQRARLEELKAAKARRRSRHGKLASRDGDSATREKAMHEEAGEVEVKSGDRLGFLDRLHTHGRRKRLTVTSFLVSILFIILRADFLLGFDQTLTSSDPRWWMTLLLDCETLLYLGICGLLHLSVCYVSLVYAYDALELGTKSGSRSKQFYGATVGVAVAAGSFGIVAMSIARAIALVWFRVAVWYFLQLRRFCLQYMEAMSASDIIRGVSEQTMKRIPPSFLHFLNSLPSIPVPIEQVARYVSAIFIFVLHWTRRIFVRSNNVGRTVETSILLLWGAFRSSFLAWDEYVDRVANAYETDSVKLPSWRGEAIRTSQYLLSYTAVFLLSILVLFNISSKRSSKRSVDEETTKDRSETLSTAFVSPPGQYRRYNSQRISSLTVHEEENERDEDGMSVSIAQSDVDERNLNGDVKTKRKKKLRLRLRRKKKPGPSSPAIEEGPHESPQTEFRKHSS